jgi:hypothetical protein
MIRIMKKKITFKLWLTVLFKGICQFLQKIAKLFGYKEVRLSERSSGEYLRLALHYCFSFVPLYLSMPFAMRWCTVNGFDLIQLRLSIVTDI